MANISEAKGTIQINPELLKTLKDVELVVAALKAFELENSDYGLYFDELGDLQEYIENLLENTLGDNVEIPFRGTGKWWLSNTLSAVQEFFNVSLSNADQNLLKELALSFNGEDGTLLEFDYVDKEGGMFQTVSGNIYYNAQKSEWEFAVGSSDIGELNSETIPNEFADEYLKLTKEDVLNELTRNAVIDNFKKVHEQSRETNDFEYFLDKLTEGIIEVFGQYGESVVESFGDYVDIDGTTITIGLTDEEIPYLKEILK